MQIDDALHIATTHGITSFYSLFSICLFHKDEGFFFNDVYLRSQNLLSVMTEDQIEAARQRIIVILGTNSLGALVVLFTVGIVSFLLFTVIFKLFFQFRMNKDVEIAGTDTINYASGIKNPRVKNFIQDIINEFYPDNIQDFLINKQKLLFKVRDGSEIAQSQFEIEDLQKLLKHVNAEIEIAKKKDP